GDVIQVIPELNNSETVSPKIVKSETVFSKTVNLGGKNAKPTLDKSLFAFSFASLCSCKGKEAKEKHPPAPVPTPRVGVADVQSAPAPVLVPRVRSATTQLTSAPIPTPRVGVASVRQVPAPVPVFCWRLWRAGPAPVLSLCEPSLQSAAAFTEGSGELILPAMDYALPQPERQPERASRTSCSLSPAPPSSLPCSLELHPVIPTGSEGVVIYKKHPITN
uniref:Uncharacterized protein n=1 Tax=Astatotilapia calliptera TaxID=8154 RepID=A0A3P8QC96_ASTCA